MGFLSKAWKGVKGAVKKVAKGVKKVAKGVVTALPGGQKLWKETGRLGKRIVTGIGKLGPVGIMAIQTVLSATGVGAALAGALSSAWSGFGAMATTAAANGSIFGTMGSAIYNGVNAIGSTLGAVGDAFSKGASKIAEGSFDGALKEFSSNMTRAFTGEAGKEGIKQGLMESAKQAAGNALAEGATSELATKAAGDVFAGGGGSVSLGQVATEEVQKDILGNALSEAGSSALSSPMNPGVTTPDFLKTGLEGPQSGMLPGAIPSYGDALNNATSSIATSSSVVMDNIGASSVTDYSGLKKSAKSLLSPSSGETSQTQDPYSMKAITSASIGNPGTGGGQASEGFSLLSGIQGLEESLRKSQNLMFS